MLELKNGTASLHVGNLETYPIEPLLQKVTAILEKQVEGDMFDLMLVIGTTKLMDLKTLYSVFEAFFESQRDLVHARVSQLAVVVPNRIMQRVFKPHIKSYVADDTPSRIFVSRNAALQWLAGTEVPDAEGV